MPTRREPLTSKMVDYLYNMAYAKTSSLHIDSSTSALADWLILGMQTGMTKSEWCQDRHILQRTKQVTRNRDGSPSAFLLDDLVFEDSHGRHIPNSRHISISNAKIIKLRWRF